MTNTEEKKLILLVDDAPANIQVAREILKDTYKTRVATSGAKALELEPFIRFGLACRYEARGPNQHFMCERVFRGLLSRIHAITHRAALHEDDGVMPILARHGCA